MQTIKSASNPQQALNQMMMSSPKLKEVMNFVQQNGGDPKSAFYNYANQLGINPDEILNMLQ